VRRTGAAKPQDLASFDSPIFPVTPVKAKGK
jgi:hypothetical protein